MEEFTPEIMKYSQEVQELYNFVYSTCSHRKPSHSHLHMQKVYNTSKEIYSKLHPEDTDFSHPTFLAVAIIAWLHDVSDHKYDDENGTLQKNLITFLNDFCSKLEIPENWKESEKNIFSPETLLNIVERISFSKEKKNGTVDWEEKMTPLGIYVRNIVSDADKLDAIGLNGLERCKEYKIEHHERNHPDDKLTGDEAFVLEAIVVHYHEKLKLLGKDYIRTEVGKEMAKSLDAEMLKGIEDIEVKIQELKS